MRWKLPYGALAVLLAVLVGCKQPCYLTKDAFDHVNTGIIAEVLVNNPNIGATPVTPLVAAPTTVINPERQIRYMPLAEAIAISLETGNIGTTTIGFGSELGPAGSSSNPTTTYIEQQPAFQGGIGGRVGGINNVRVLSLDPAGIGAGIEASLSKFDAVWSSSINWQNTDRPVGTSLDAFQTGNATTNAITSQDVTFNTALLKALPTGGVAGISFNTAYEYTNLPARVNPSYRPTLQFQFEQPLLQGFGVEINQLRAAHPGSILSPGVLNTAPTSEGILITRLRFDQQRAQFEALIQVMLVNVETAYWNLYNAYWNLYAAEAGLRQSFEAYKINKARYEAGRVGIADLAQSRGQYENFRGQRLGALNELLDLERQFRGMLGIEIEDGTRIVPSDTPTIAPYQPNWDMDVQQALALKPELVFARQEIKAAQLNLIAQKNALLPDLRFAATYDINDIGTRLDGPDTNNALRNLASDHYNNWGLQLRMVTPIGFRNAHANVRIAELQLQRAYYVLAEGERSTKSFLAEEYRRVIAAYELIRSGRATREAYADQLRARFQEFLAGRGTLDVLLEAQRFWSSALATEYQEIRDYNIALAAYEYAKGTIMTRDNVLISEGPLPGCAATRAVEHYRERADALKLRERATLSELSPVPHDEAAPAPVPPAASGTSVRDLWQTSPPLETPPELPAPTDLGKPAGTTTRPTLPPLGGPTSAAPAPMPPAPTASAPTTPAPMPPAPTAPAPTGMLPALKPAPSLSVPAAGATGTDFGAGRSLSGGMSPMPLSDPALLAPPPPVGLPATPVWRSGTGGR